jgi:hypothetical protein
MGTARMMLLASNLQIMTKFGIRRLKKTSYRSLLSHISDIYDRGVHNYHATGSPDE